MHNRSKGFYVCSKGFTIVELLVVIVVIGILAAITIVSYISMSQRAVAATLKSDLKNASILLEMDNVNDGSYPSSEAEVNDGSGFSPSPGTIYSYVLTDTGYCLSATSSTIDTSYRVTTGGIVEEGSCASRAVAYEKLSIGLYHSCGVGTDGLAYCWGLNGAGQLGNNSTANSRVPVPVYVEGALNGKTIKSISVGREATCVIASDDLVYCWGSNGNGAFGAANYTDSLVPVRGYTTATMSGKTIKLLSLSTRQSCVVASDDLAYCSGYNYNGQLGDGSTTSTNYPVSVLMGGVLSGKTVKTISTTYVNGCIIASDDLPYCWGVNDQGQVGDGTNEDRLSPVPVIVNGVLAGKTVDTLEQAQDAGPHVCVIASDSLPYCWGGNYYSQLGNGQSTYSNVPVSVNMDGLLSGKTAKSISVGEGNTCLVASDNMAYCWGYNNYGQLGDNSTENRTSPVSVYSSGGLLDKHLSAIKSGSNHTCVVDSEGDFYCWGWNLTGQLGNGAIPNSSVPVAASIGL